MRECEASVAPITREKGAADVTAWCRDHHDHIYSEDHIYDHHDHIYNDNQIYDHHADTGCEELDCPHHNKKREQLT